MPKYLCVQRNLPSPDAEPPSAADMQAMYARFEAWRTQFADQLVDLGGRVGANRIVSDATADGPFAEVKELIGGYMIVSADSLDGAAEVASACPGLVRPGSGVEILEIFVPGE